MLFSHVSLICGDVCGEFTSLIAKVSKVHASHGPFSFLFCVGQFFANASHDNSQLQPYIAHQATLPLPIYFIASHEYHTALIDHLPAGGELCPNLTYLGRSGVRRLGGLTVGYLSGEYDSERYFEVNEEERRQRYECHYTEDDIIALNKEAAGEQLDLLLTAEWAKNFHTLLPATALPASIAAPPSVGSPVIARLAAQLSIRYHFAGNEDCYFELPPYRNSGYYTRFFGLGKHGSKRKQKSLYACHIAPAATVDRTQLPAEVTACPYTVSGVKRDKATAEERSGGVGGGGDGNGEAKRMKTAGFVRAGAVDMAMADMPKADEMLVSQRWDFVPPSRRPPPPNYICNACNQPGHWIQGQPRHKQRISAMWFEQIEHVGCSPSVLFFVVLTDCPNKAAPTDSDVPPPTYVCKKCGQPGHYIRLCPLLAQENAARAAGVPPPNYVCRKCSQAGHFIQNCPLVKAEEEEKASSKAARGDRPPPGYACKKCGSSEHFIRECPLIREEEERKRDGHSTVPPGYKCKKCGGDHWIQSCPLIVAEEAEKKKAREAAADGEEKSEGCWFCLATNNVAMHLVVAVGDECYVALAKGPLLRDHLLILPIAHVQAATELNEPQTQEMSRFRDALTRYYSSMSLTPLFYERNIPTRAGQHFHLQCVPLTAQQQAAALPLLQSEAAALNIQLDTLTPSTSLKEEVGGEPYITFEVAGQTLLHRVVKGRVPGLFDWQRNVVAKVLGVPEKGDWRRCKQSVEEETEMVDSIKEAFKPFDFTQE